MRTMTPNMSLPTPARSDESGAFLEEMSELMGLPVESSGILKGPSPFWGPGGLMCRLQVSSESDATAVQPQVMLPMSADDLRGQEVDRLLAIQAAVLSETGWCLGVSREGLMQLSLMSWIDVPCEAVEALGLGNAVALQTLHLLMGGEDEEDDGDDVLDFPSPRCSNDTCH